MGFGEGWVRCWLLDVDVGLFRGVCMWLCIKRQAYPTCKKKKQWCLILFLCCLKGYFNVSVLPVTQTISTTARDRRYLYGYDLISDPHIGSLHTWFSVHLDWGETTLSRLVWWKEVTRSFWPSLPILVTSSFVSNKTHMTCHQDCFWHRLQLYQKQEIGIAPTNYSIHCINLWVALIIDMLDI